MGDPDLSVHPVPWYRLDKLAQGYRFRYRQRTFDYLTSGNYWVWVYTTEERRR